jgi:hypothetical protein
MDLNCYLFLAAEASYTSVLQGFKWEEQLIRAFSTFIQCYFIYFACMFFDIVTLFIDKCMCVYKQRQNKYLFLFADMFLYFCNTQIQWQYSLVELLI